MRIILSVLVRASLWAGLLFAAGCALQTRDPVRPQGVKAAARATRGGGGGGGVPAPAPTPLVILTTFMPDGNLGAPYSQFIASSGGLGTPHLFRVVAGRLPDGLSMASSFGVNYTVVTCIPRLVGVSTFTVQVQDQTGHSATQALSINIAAPLALVVNTPGPTLTPGTIGASYTVFLFAGGGAPPYTWAIIA